MSVTCQGDKAPERAAQVRPKKVSRQGGESKGLEGSYRTEKEGGTCSHYGVSSGLENQKESGEESQKYCSPIALLQRKGGGREGNT